MSTYDAYPIDDSVRAFLSWRARKRRAGQPLPSQLHWVGAWLSLLLVAVAAAALGIWL